MTRLMLSADRCLLARLAWGLDLTIVLTILAIVSSISPNVRSTIRNETNPGSVVRHQSLGLNIEIIELNFEYIRSSSVVATHVT